MTLLSFCTRKISSLPGLAHNPFDLFMTLTEEKIDHCERTGRLNLSDSLLVEMAIRASLLIRICCGGQKNYESPTTVHSISESFNM